MDKLQENTLIYIHMCVYIYTYIYTYIYIYIYTHTQRHADRQTYINTDTDIHIYTLFRQYFQTLSFKVFKLFAFLIDSGMLFQIEVPIKEIDFYPSLSCEKDFEVQKSYFSVYPTMWGEFKNFIELKRAIVIDKIVAYSIYALINPFAGR